MFKYIESLLFCNILVILILFPFTICNDIHAPYLNLHFKSFSSHSNIQSSILPKELQYHGTTTISFIYRDGVIIAVDSRASIGSFVGSKSVKKIFPITRNIVATMAGGAADCSYWIRHTACYVKLQQSLTDSIFPVRSVAKIMSSYLRQNRGNEISVGTMIAGTVASRPSLYYVDDEGTCIEGKCFCVGSGSRLAYSVLDSVRSLEALSLDDAMDIAERAVRQASNLDAYSGGYINIFHVNETGYHHVKRIEGGS